MAMDHKADELLQKLRIAIHDCLCSEDIERTVRALERSGYRVFVSLDAVQDEALDELLNEVVDSPDTDTPHWSASDELFLKALHIEVDDASVR